MDGLTLEPACRCHCKVTTMSSWKHPATSAACNFCAPWCPVHRIFFWSPFGPPGRGAAAQVDRRHVTSHAQVISPVSHSLHRTMEVKSVSHTPCPSLNHRHQSPPHESVAGAFGPFGAGSRTDCEWLNLCSNENKRNMRRHEAVLCLCSLSSWLVGAFVPAPARLWHPARGLGFFGYFLWFFGVFFMVSWPSIAKNL